MQKRPTGNKRQICLECQIHKAENEKLRQEIRRLNQLISGAHISNQPAHGSCTEVSEKGKSAIEKVAIDSEIFEYSLPVENPTTEQLIFSDSPVEIITKESSLTPKIALFRRLFKGREDVFANRNSFIHTALAILESHSIRVVLTNKLSCNAVIIDQRILWYGSLPPLGFHNENDSIMRIESPKLARDMQSVLMKDSVLDKS